MYLCLVINLYLQDIENLGDDVDYSVRFITDREYYSLDEIHAWGDEIALEFGFKFTRASFKQKEGCSRVSLYLRWHRFGSLRGELHNLDNVARSGSRSRACGCKFMIVRSSRKPGERPWTVRVCLGEKGRHNHPFLVYRDGHIRATTLSVDIQQHIR